MHGESQEARICLEGIPRKWNREVLYGGLPGRKPKLPVGDLISNAKS
jgi:hypothetical protein